MKRTRGREHDALRKQEMAKEVKGHSEKSGSLTIKLTIKRYKEIQFLKNATKVKRVGLEQRDHFSKSVLMVDLNYSELCHLKYDSYIFNHIIKK